MDINNPHTSRMLAILIQTVAAKDRPRFISDAKKAPDMETFFSEINKYTNT
jgi:hypothetical protein